jgi:predicted nucleic acid-binding protein
VTELVLDASVLVKWFRRQGEGHVEEALALRSAFEEGRLLLLAPPLVHLELINLAGRRWNWTEERLLALVRLLKQLGLQLVEPELERVAFWTASGLTAYDAAYVAVAEAAEATLVTADGLVLSTATAVARPLASWAQPGPAQGASETGSEDPS